MKNIFHRVGVAISIAVFGMGIAAVSAKAECSNSAKKVIQSLSGSWRGTGTVTPIRGRKGRISCRIRYGGSGDNLRQRISCSGSNFRFEASARVRCDDNRLSGSWTENIAHNTGSVSGRVTGRRLNFAIRGPNFEGHVDVRIASAARHSLAITQFDTAAGRQVPIARVTLTH
jgi:hypothetical protein